MRLRDKLKLAVLFHKLTSDPVMFQKLQSRKFWAVVVTGVIIVFGDNLGVSADATHWLAGIVGSYILGQGAVDAAKAVTSAK